jgi:LmbE family N-acetylglucosaminyl deacetylase
MKILGLSAHTDDVELAAGGKLVKHLEAGDQLKIMVFSYCQESLPDRFPRDTLKKEFELSMKVINIENYQLFNYPVRNFSEWRQAILNDLIRAKDVFQPDLVITHSLNDLHQDHQVVALESIRAFKNATSILAMQMPHNNLEFKNQYYERLTEEQMKKKVFMLEQYESQKYVGRRLFVSDELVYAWARLNGFCCNSEFAECFEVVRMIA